jgi:hypothetical protein
LWPETWRRIASETVHTRLRDATWRRIAPETVDVHLRDGRPSRHWQPVCVAVDRHEQRGRPWPAMTALPRDPDRFATKDDLVVLEATLRAEITNLRAEIKGASAVVIRTLMFGLIASNATLVGLVFAAVKLA